MRYFFADCGQGKVYENENIECEDLCGWLIPKEIADIFEPLFLSNSAKQNVFDDYYVYVDFKITDEKIEIIID